MSRKKKPASRKQSPPKQTRSTITFSQPVQDTVVMGIFVIFLLILLKPLVIDGLSSQGVDAISSLAKTHQVVQFKEKTGETALWNPAIYNGMPIYHRLNPKSFSLDTILDWLSVLTNGVFIYYLFAAAGMYFLLRYLQFNTLISFVITLIFILLPHYQSLHVEGHFAKFKALMILPWVMLTFKYFLNKRSILSIALFALVFGVQIRTQHYQIIFYTAFLIMAVGLYPFIQDLIQRNYKRFAVSAMLLVAGLALSILMAAQPLFLAKEYLPYSKRGKTTIELDNPSKIPSENLSDGVDIGYATQWSTQPTEMMTWLIPRFYGGMSSERYTGSAIPQLRNRIVPGYWGYMPFTQSYEYMGALTVILALIGFFAFRRDKSVLSLGILAVFFILLSFGRHFLSFYQIFFDYFPYFNKFRAPMMSVTITSFLMCIFAAYGFRTLSEKAGADTGIKKRVLYVFGGIIALGLIVWIASSGFSFISERDQQQYVDTLRTIRQEFFRNDLIRFFLIVFAGGAATAAFLYKKISFKILIVILGLISAIDLINIQSRSVKEYANLDRIEKQYFRKSATDQFIESDKSLFRIFPTADLFTDNRWAYYHETIGGYTPIKMYVIEEMVENNLYKGPNRNFPVNWNIMKILNVKYLILKQAVSDSNVLLVHQDQATKLNTYLFRNYSERGFFVGRYEVIGDDYERLRKLNDPSFDPAEVALLEEPLSEKIQKPDSSIVRVTDYNPNLLSFDVFTDKQSLFVISQTFYPPGWKIFLDDSPVEKIFKTDHAIQSIVIPPGNHMIKMEFVPESYFKDIRLSYISLGILYLGILIPLVLEWYRKRGQSASAGSE